MIDITPIVEAVIGLMATLITMKLLPWLQARLTAQQQEMLRATTRTLVYAAEQIYGAGNGAEKLEYVRREMQARGFAVDAAAVEAAVREMGQALAEN